MIVSALLWAAQPAGKGGERNCASLSYLQWPVSNNHSLLPSPLSHWLFFHKIAVSLWPPSGVLVCCFGKTKYWRPKSPQLLHYSDCFTGR